ncbi:MAG: 50S ribosomal protein L15 [Acidobacteriota bacterium]|nr:MAG: 50S ribosomal protein L15 [Acidobacteriota bacterium]
MRLHDIGPAPGATRPRKRVGRGPGSGHGKTAGRGHKGQKSRSGYSRAWYFEGGQMPLVRRVPKRGFHNPFRQEFAEVNVGQLAGFEAGTEVSPETLAERGILKRSETRRVKLLGSGEIAVALKVQVHAASAAAREKVEAAGGSVQILGG